MPQAVYKLTGLPSSRFGLKGKGIIRPGADADLCLFSPDAIHETATWQQPRQLAQGMDWVFVRGIPAIAHGKMTGATNGQML